MNRCSIPEAYELSVLPISSLETVLLAWCAENPAAPTLAALGGAELNRAELCALLATGRRALHGAGLVAGDRVALMVPQGLDAAVALLQAAVTCDVAALQPATAGLVATQLRALNPAAIISPAGWCAEAEAVADELGIRWIEPSDLRGPPTTVLPPARDRSAVTHLIVATSGSTGPPKWVRLDLAGVIEGCRATARMLELSEQDRILLPLPLNHTHGIVTGLLTPLISGGSITITARFDPAEMITGIREHGVTWLTLPPAMHRALMEQNALTPLGEHHLRFLRSGSAGMPAYLAQKITESFGVPLIEAYGMSECPHIACNPLTAPRIGSVGMPVVSEVAIVDDVGSQRPVGEWGNVKVRGAPMMRGYLQARQRTNPVDGAGWLSTGDEGRLDEEGYLHIRGRIDEAINRGGLKLMPADVDAALMAHPGVREAVAFAVPHPSLGEDLAAAVVPAPDARVDQASLNSFLAGRLPNHMLPSQIILVPGIEVEPSGKVARRRLAQRLSSVLHVQHQAPQGPTEELLVDLFQEVLADRMPPGWQVGRFTNFLLEGGDSLAAMRLLARLNTRGWEDISPQALFERPTPAALAEVLGASAVPAVCSEKYPSSSLDSDLGGAPASPAQSGLWFQQQLNPSLTAYHLPQLWTLIGEIDLSALNAALTALVERHATLRTSFRLAGGDLFQDVHPPSAIAVRQEDLRGRDPAEAIADLQRQEAADPFDLTTGVLLRATLLRVGLRKHVLLLNHHHIASDGWSESVLVRDLGVLYNACRAKTVPKLRPLPVQYRDYARRQRERLVGKRWGHLRAYWSAQLDGLDPLRLPTDGPGRVVSAGNGAAVDFAIDGPTSAVLETLCRDEGVTLQMALVAALAVLIHQETARNDLVVGVPVWGRNHPELEDMVGLFVNVLPIRVRIDPATPFRHLLGHVRTVSLGAYTHQEFPFDEIAKVASEPRDSVRHPLVRVLLQLVEGEHSSSLEFDGVMAEPIERMELSTRFDLEFQLQRAPDGGLAGTLTFGTDLFAPARMDRLTRAFQNVVESVARQPDLSIKQLAGLSARVPPEHWQRGPEVNVADLCLHQLFAQRVAQSPDAVALVCGDEEWSFAELDERANRLAHKLIAAGVGAESMVALCLNRSVGMVVTLLAILKSGAAYVPLDPAWPSGRKSLAIRLIGSRRWVVTDDERAREWSVGATLVDPADPGLPDYPSECPDCAGHSSRRLVYVNFTSGSTGNPKGVLIEHRGVLRLLDPKAPWAMTAGDRMLQLAPLAFDAATLEIWLPLLSGPRWFWHRRGNSGLIKSGNWLPDRAFPCSG